jgi:hypothetical protein
LKEIIEEVYKRALSLNRKADGPYCELSLATRHDLVVGEVTDVARALRNDKDLFNRVRVEFNLPIRVEDLDTCANFSVFRNYRQRDSVMSPLDKSLNIHDYLSNFGTSNLLALTNYDRYSQEFCAYIRCLFGADVSTGMDRFIR